MPKTRIYKNYSSLSNRVAHAYFKYGCFCSSHPIVTILSSIGTLLLLSYPLSRLRLASSAPFEIVTADNISTESLRLAVSEGDPDLVKQMSWLFDDGAKRRSPLAFVQQIVIKARINPWNSFEMTPSDAVKGPLELAFDLTEKVQAFRFESTGLDDYCFRVQSPDLATIKLHHSRFPAHKCLLLSPASLWGNDRQKFYEDNNILETIFEPQCTNSLCIRHLLFGMTNRHAGIKRHYQTNRQRDICFALTIVLFKYDEAFIEALRNHLQSDPSYFFQESAPSNRLFVEQQRDDKFILIYYLLPKDFSQHIPLALSYCLLFVYLYYSVRKIQMVKSKWGLAFSAVFTIAASLVMASGICVNFDLTPRLWRGDLFPYLAMILGIENTLCLTRSVVSTPVSLPVEQRIAHGLSREGWLITKNFLIELAVVLIGVLTRIPEIQEFCTLGCIGLVVDFYMQLFFYAPCLTFDLLRFDPAEIERLSIMQLSMNPVELAPYPSVRCPIMQCLAKLFPTFISSRNASMDEENMDPVRRSRSMSSVAGAQLSTVDPSISNSTANKAMGHRRTASNTSDVSVNIDSILAPNLAAALLRRVPLSRRLKILMFWSRYRYCQRIFTVVMIVWIAWLALIVHQWHLIGKFSNSLDGMDNRNGSAALNNDPNLGQNQSSKAATVESSWVHWALAQRTTFRWWPVLFNIYNISMTGEHVILLPRIVLNAEVTPERAKAIRSGVESASANDGQSGGDRRGGLAMGIMNDLGVRISWLEFQMLAVLIMSVGIFLTVGGFILYVCFVGGDSSTDSVYETDASPWTGQSRTSEVKKTHKRIGSKTLVDAVPVVFARHDYDVELVRRVGDVLVSACLDGRILIWDAKSGDVLHQARPYESRVASGPATSTPNETEIRQRRANIANGVTAPQPTNQDEQTFTFLQFDTENRASIWCMDAQSQLIAAGFSNGDVELYDLRTGLLRGRNGSGNGVGATQICLKGSHVIVARLNGQLDFMELRLVQHGSPQRQYLQCHPIRSVTAHQRQINRLATSSMGVMTASDDHTLKMFDLHKYSCVCTFYGHNAPVLEVVIDQDMQMMYTSCSDGLLCIWDLVDRCLIRTLPELSYTVSPVALAFTTNLLVGHGQDGTVWLWKKSTGELVTRMKSESRRSPSGDGSHSEWTNSICHTSSLVVLSGNLAVTSTRDALRFWDLEYKAMLREVKLSETDKTLGSVVKNLTSLDGFSVACSKGNVLFRVDFPVIRAH